MKSDNKWRKSKLTFMSRCRTCWRWMNWMPSQICRMKMAQALSVSTKSSSITRSKSSPPSMLSRAPRKRGKMQTKTNIRQASFSADTAGSAVSTQSLSVHFSPPPQNKKIKKKQKKNCSSSNACEITSGPQFCYWKGKNGDDLQFKQKTNLFLAVVKGVVKLYESGITQRFHDLDLAFHVDPVGLFGRLDEFGRKAETSFLLSTLEHSSEFTSVQTSNKSQQLDNNKKRWR